MDSILTDELRASFTFDSGTLTAGFLGVIVSAIALGCYHAFVQLAEAARMPVIQLRATRSAPLLMLSGDHKSVALSSARRPAHPSPPP